MNTYAITLANGHETLVVADTPGAAIAFAARTTLTRPLVAVLVSCGAASEWSRETPKWRA